MEKTISQFTLRSFLMYNKMTGVFTWRWHSRVHPTFRGKVAGCDVKHELNGKTYKTIKVCGTPFAAHRLAWVYVYGCMPTHQIDHIDGNGLNNAILNLRDVSQQENCRNVRMKSNNTSGIVGVGWMRHKERCNRHIKSLEFLRLAQALNLTA